MREWLEIIFSICVIGVMILGLSQVYEFNVNLKEIQSEKIEIIDSNGTVIGKIYGENGQLVISSSGIAGRLE